MTEVCCNNCEKKFKKVLYCSTRCRVQAHRKRQNMELGKIFKNSKKTIQPLVIPDIPEGAEELIYESEEW